MSLKIDLRLPSLSVEEQYEEGSGTGKIIMGHFDSQGNFISFWKNLTYMEKLFVIDSLKRRMEDEVKLICLQDDEEDDDEF